jgi:hypothetical protein
MSASDCIKALAGSVKYWKDEAISWIGWANEHKPRKAADLKPETEREQTQETKKLHKVESIAGRFPHQGCVYPNVHIMWFIERDKPPIQYREAILNYEAARDGTKLIEETAIDQLFTETEARVFTAYLLAVHCVVASTEEVILPVAKSILPVNGPTLGSGPDYYSIHKEPKYNLNFKVSGLYWLAGKPIEGNEDDMPF